MLLKSARFYLITTNGELKALTNFCVWTVSGKDLLKELRGILPTMEEKQD